MTPTPTTETTPPITLRDFFAAAALQGMLAHDESATSDYTVEGFVESAYKIADAMLKAREK